MPRRTASTRWTGGLNDGSGHTVLETSGAGEYDISLPKRASEEGTDQTDPEELIAAAHSACLAMNMSGVLEGEGLRADALSVTSTVSLGQDPAGGFAIRKIALEMTASIPGVDEDRFQELATKAHETCPVSKALSATPMTFTAKMD